MEADKGGAERRKQERFMLKERVFATFRPTFERIGWITDISKSGISIEYSDFENYSPLSDMIHVDVFSSPRKIELINLPCRLVYDKAYKASSKNSDLIETRRCGLSYRDLTLRQRNDLDMLINVYSQ